MPELVKSSETLASISTYTSDRAALPAYLEAVYHVATSPLYFGGIRRRVLTVHEILGGAVECEHQGGPDAGSILCACGPEPHGGHPRHRDLLGPRLHAT